MRVNILDTKTGWYGIVDERDPDTGEPIFDAQWWCEGNGSCDCNRWLLFPWDNKGERPGQEWDCLGCERFLVAEWDDPDAGTPIDFNANYPIEMLKQHLGITDAMIERWNQQSGRIVIP